MNKKSTEEQISNKQLTETKPRYQTPKMIQLNELTRGNGVTTCTNGSGADMCGNGGGGNP